MDINFTACNLLSYSLAKYLLDFWLKYMVCIFQVVESYQIIFYLSVGMLIFGSFVFTLFGSADKLNLNPKKTDAKTTEEVN